MKKILFLLSLTVLCLLYSCGGNNEKDVAEITAFIESLYAPEGFNLYTDNSWLKQHCSEDVLQLLKDEYEYDCEEGDCYGSWLLVGEPLGDIEEKVLKGVHHDSADAHHYVAEIEYSDIYKTATIYVRYQVKMKNGTPVIEDIDILEGAESEQKTQADASSEIDFDWVLGVFRATTHDNYFGNVVFQYDIRRDGIIADEMGERVIYGYQIAFEDGDYVIKLYDRNGNYYSRLILDVVNHRLNIRDRIDPIWATKVGNATQPSAYNNRQNNVNTGSANQTSSTRFQNYFSVVGYLVGSTFKSHDGVKINVRQDGIYVNNTCMTGAFEIDEFNATRALFHATSVYSGGRYELLVDCQGNYLVDTQSNIYYYRQ